MLAQHGAELAREAGFEAEALAVADDADMPVAETIVNVAREQGAAAIVIGAHGHSRLSEVVLGSTSRDVIRRAPCPVVIARPVTGTLKEPLDTDVAIVGAGVVGCAIARELSQFDLRVTLLEAGPDVGAGTSKANTALLHTGFDAKPGTLEARLVARGFELLSDYAGRVGIPVERTGALLVAWNEEQRARVPRHRRARARERLPRDRARSESTSCTGASPTWGRAPTARSRCRRGARLPVHHAARLRDRGGARADATCAGRPPSRRRPARGRRLPARPRRPVALSARYLVNAAGPALRRARPHARATSASPSRRGAAS